MVIVTKKFKPAPGLYASILLRRWIFNNLWWLIMPVTIFLAAGIFLNESFFYVAVIYILCVASISQAIIFFNYALRPDTVVKTFSQHWEFSEHEAKVIYHPTTTINDETVSPLTDSTIVPREKISRLNISARNLVITLGNDYDIHIIPLGDLSAGEDLNKLFKFYETAC